jgi:iron(III) transport system substrate-binding protein
MRALLQDLARLVLAILTVLGFAGTLYGESASVEKAREEGKLVFYAAMNAADSVRVQSGFEKKYPQIKVELVRAGAPALLQRILTEARGGKVFADAVLGFGYIHYELDQQKLLAKFASTQRQAFSAQFKDNEGYWTNVFPIVHTVAYNTKMLPPPELPGHYADLLLPKWKDKTGMNGNNIMFLAAIMNFYGRDKGMDFLRKLAAQNPQVRGGGTQLTMLLAAGEFPLAFSINENNVESFKQRGGPIDWARLADPLYGETVPIGIMAGAAHPNAARLFVDYVLSKEGQELLKELGKVPARSDVAPRTNIEREKIRMIPPEEEAKTAYYGKLFDDLFVKRRM